MQIMQIHFAGNIIVVRVCAPRVRYMLGTKADRILYAARAYSHRRIFHSMQKWRAVVDLISKLRTHFSMAQIIPLATDCRVPMSFSQPINSIVRTYDYYYCGFLHGAMRISILIQCWTRSFCASTWSSALNGIGMWREWKSERSIVSTNLIKLYGQ